MKKLVLIFIVSIFAFTLVNCASNEVKQTPPPVEEPKPSKKPKLDESLKQRQSDIK
ncbi:hypothetical protein LPTSP4_01850 [Leptospira ryugenii]|uniref:Lipoprotein n=1 Tax=Leptospira ryugenii TaxID=1917863 RepID=A0A2P2DVN3_9LEPT|nr:hypothetical protein [Leptospira ryugenii]GBF48685.1 hypothetical protein LPTSP4_01850 [Leptospira ryugenii]